ncbi:MAG: hypothetical protein MUP81_05780 [Dehalococcoidia bacterium]|nr:hypothetical protein [Dehalococcoidia bacterium]
MSEFPAHREIPLSLLALILKRPKIIKSLVGKEIEKIIFIPDSNLINIVTRED